MLGEISLSNASHYSMRALGTGKTYSICKAAKECGAIVITHSEEEAKRIRELYDVKAISMHTRVEGLSCPILVDTNAVSSMAQKAIDIINCERGMRKALEKKILAIKSILKQPQ